MRVGVIGGSGYAGGELLRLLDLHPSFDVGSVGAHSNSGQPITSIHPHLESYSGQEFTSIEVKNFSDCDLIFLALPHGESAHLIAEIPKSTLIVDLGADYRLSSADAWKTYYGGEHAGTWVYGLPELFRDSIIGQTRVANPGCYATAITLGATPAAQIADMSDIVVVAASGTTGAGRSAKTHLLASEVMGSMSSYKFGGVHQHTPEIEEAIFKATQVSSTLSFTPILAPQPRGILATISMRTSATRSQIRDAYRDKYAKEKFITLLDEGAMPRTSSVTGTNMVHVQVAFDERASRVSISVAIDNLGKGAAGQAIQNANIIAGIAEDTGLGCNGIGS